MKLLERNVSVNADKAWALTAVAKCGLAQTGAAAADYLRASAAALQASRAAPPLQATDTTLKGYAVEIQALRREALTRSLSAEDVERLFALGFALEQIRNNLKDLESRVAEWADDPKPEARG